MTSCTLDFPLTPQRHGDRAISRDARFIREMVANVGQFPEPVVSGTGHREVLGRLKAACNASAPVELSTFLYAREFVERFAHLASMPDVSVDADGDISFDWEDDGGSMFAVSVSRDGTLNYAGLFGLTRMYGTEHFSDDIPELISVALARLSGPRFARPILAGTTYSLHY